MTYTFFCYSCGAPYRRQINRPGQCGHCQYAKQRARYVPKTGRAQAVPVAAMAAFDWAPVRELVLQGLNLAVISRESGLTRNAVAKWAASEGLQIGGGRRVREIKDLAAEPRTQRMVTMFEQGLTLNKIGCEFNITRERVRQILTRVGAHKKRAELLAPIRAAKLANERATKDARAFAKWGMPAAQLRELRDCGLKRAFTEQKNNARHRAVGWNLTLAQWFAVWQASGKLDQRGRGKDCYCMSRIRDDGPYELGNVHVQTNVQNAREGFNAARLRGKAKGLRGVFNIYPGTPRPWLAKADGHRLGFFASADEAVAARTTYLAAHPSVRGALLKPQLSQDGGDGLHSDRAATMPSLLHKSVTAVSSN